MILLSLALALTQFTALAVKDIASQAMAPFTAIQLKQRGSTPVFVIDVIQDVERFSIRPNSAGTIASCVGRSPTCNVRMMPMEGAAH